MHIANPLSPHSRRDHSVRTIADMLADMRPISGGAKDDPPEISEQVENLAQLTDEEIEALEAQIQTRGEELAEEDTDAALEELTALSDSIAQVREEKIKREQAAEERATAREEALAKIRPPEPEAEAEEEEETPAPEETEEETAGAETPAETPATEETAPTAEEEEEAVAAAAPPAKPTPARIASRRPAQRPRPTSEADEFALIASGEVSGVAIGGRYNDWEHVGRAFADKYEFAMKSGREGRFPVAHVDLEMPEERTLTASGEQNRQRIEAVIAEMRKELREPGAVEALIAAGGLCPPPTPRYQLDVFGSQARPLRDALVRFNADRGGIVVPTSPILSDVGSGVTVWTEANDTTPSSPTTKPCVTISCGAFTEIDVSAITRCAQVGNFNRKFFPEQFQAWWELLGVSHARLAEETIWDRLVSLSTAITTGQLLGTARDVLENCEQVAAEMRYRNRLAADAPIQFFAPAYLKNEIRSDLTRQQPGDDELGTTDAEIDSFFAARNIVPVWSLDGDGSLFAAQGAAALVRYPTTVETVFAIPGSFLFLDGGSLDFGMEIRDTTMNSLNNSQAFMETFEEVAKVGPQTLAVTMDVCPSGKTSLPVSIDPCTTGS